MSRQRVPITLVRAAALTVASMTIVLGVGGCRGERSSERPRQFFPGMDDQPKYKPQATSDFFADGRAMREPMAGTVPFGRRPDARDEWVSANDQRRNLLREDDAMYRGLDENGEYVQVIPVRAVLGVEGDDQVTPEMMRRLIERGRDQYNIFCLVCHGGTGDGDGMVGRQWSAPLPSFHEDRLRRGGESGQDGHIFHVIRNGLANAPGQLPALRMPAYGDRVSERDAWAIVAYLRSLQETRAGELADVPENRRRELINQRGAAGARGTTDGGAE